MKLEMKAIKYAAFASEETSCYEATVYLNGKPWARVSNEGHGGSDYQWPVGRSPNDSAFEAEIKEVNAYLAETSEGMAYNAEYSDLIFDLEAWCYARVADYLITREMRRAMAKKAVFAKGGGIYTMAYKSAKPDDRLYAEVKKRHPDAVILNTLPEDEALAIFRAA